MIRLLPILLILSICQLNAQDIDSPLLVFNRGQLWQSVYMGKVGPSTYNNWRRLGIGLDWPGFDISWIREDIGGAPSYLTAGGFWIGCKKTRDSVLAVEDWSIYASTVGVEVSSKFIVKKHKKTINHGMVNIKDAGDEIIVTSWEYNPLYQNQYDIESQLPIRVTRESHQWNGSRREENYIIHKYTIKNISNEIRINYPTREIVDTLYDFYAMLNYGMQCNSRSWTVLYPTYSAGARNSWFFYDPSKKMIWGRAGDYLDTPENDGEYGWSATQGPIVNGSPTGEWLSPGFVGFRLLYSSPNNNGTATFVNGYGWSAGDNLQDLIGPMTGRGTAETRYSVLKDVSMANNYINNPGDQTFMRRSRMWSLMSVGPWDINPGDSVVIVYSEMVDGSDYKYALENKISAISSGYSIFDATAVKSKVTFDNNFNHPDPPLAPEFTVDYNREDNQYVSNIIQWGNETESIPDPDDGLLDLSSYKIYRSEYLPIGPWTLVAEIQKGDINYYSNTTEKYTYLDSTVTVGASYYYALTALDTGRASWNINPAVIFPETQTTKVPPLESSIFANRMNTPFTATLAPVNNVNQILVVPNPFVIGEGYSLPGEGDKIQFVNIPNPCTIRIYTVRGDLVKTINVESGEGAIASWDQVSDFGQFVESGVYLFHVESPYGPKLGKFAIVR
ncbi:MAG: hypothetical protein V1773_00820 [bacterium]